MDIGRAFRAIFDDPGWAGKLLLAFLFEILVVTGPAVAGYFAQYIRDVAEGHDVPLPEWRGFWTYWWHGFLIIVAGFVYVTVGLLLFVIGIIPAVILLPAAVVEYTQTWRGRSLYAIPTAFRRIRAYPQFWTAWLVTFGLGIAVSVVTSPFSSARSASAAALGGLISALLGLYTSLVSEHLYGQYAYFAFGFAGRQAPTAPAPAGQVAPPPPPGGFAPSH